MSGAPRAIFFDIDGTLINEKGGPFPEDLKALEAARREGHRVFLNTGRSFGNIPQAVLEVPLWDGVAAGGGAHVLLADQGRYVTIYHRVVPPELLGEIAALFLKTTKLFVFEGEEDCYIINPSTRSFSVKAPRIIKSREDFRRDYPDAAVTKLTVDGFFSLEERELLEPWFRINAFSDYSEAIIKGETKATAMGIILDALGLKREDSIAVGDSVNDLDMIRFAGLGVAMGNASPELKAAAGALTGNCGEGGAAGVIRRFVLA